MNSHKQKPIPKLEKLLQLPEIGVGPSKRIRDYELKDLKHLYWGTHPAVVSNVYDLTKQKIYDTDILGKPVKIDPFLKRLMKESQHPTTLNKTDRNYITPEGQISKAKVWNHLHSRADQTTTRDRNLFARGKIDTFDGYYSWTKGEYQQFLSLSKQVYAGTGVKVTFVELDPKNIKRDKIMIRRHKKYLQDGPAEPRTVKQWQKPEPFKRLFGYDAFLPGLKGMEGILLPKRYIKETPKKTEKPIPGPPTRDMDQLKQELWKEALYYYNIVFLKNNKRTLDWETDEKELEKIIDEELAKKSKKHDVVGTRKKLLAYIKFMFKRDWKNEQLVKVRGKKVKRLVPVQQKPKKKQEKKKPAPQLDVVNNITAEQLLEQVSKYSRLKLRKYGAFSRSKIKKDKELNTQFKSDFNKFKQELSSTMREMGKGSEMRRTVTLFKNLEKREGLLTSEQYSIYFAVLDYLGRKGEAKEVLVSHNAAEQLESLHSLRKIERERKMGVMSKRVLVAEFKQFKTEERRKLAKK